MNENKIFKRLGKEHQKILKTNKKVLSYKDDNDNIVFEINYTSEICLKIVMNETYPFSSPNISVNNIDYCNYLQSKIVSLNRLIILMNIPCPCCYNIINAWSPGYYLTSIMNEFEDNMKLTNLLH